MSDAENDNQCEENAFINELTLNFLISKTQLQKLHKMKQKEEASEQEYDKDRIAELFNQLLNNNRPDDLLEDVKTCFDAFIEKSIYYLEIHDKNADIQNERNETIEKNADDFEDEGEDEGEEDDDFEDKDEDDFEEEDDEPIVKVHTKYSNYNISNGVEDIHKLPLDWFNTTRQNYKINQIIPRKKEIIIDNTSLQKKKI
jgi:hypothetical protein